jgi:hypothetical protein
LYPSNMYGTPKRKLYPPPPHYDLGSTVQYLLQVKYADIDMVSTIPPVESLPEEIPPVVLHIPIEIPRH